MGHVDVNRAYGLVIVGDEILLGRRQDKHFSHVLARLQELGLRMAWARFLPDDGPVLVENLRQTRAASHPVLVFGGIGATPDDITRQAAAEAWGLPLVRHPDAVAEIERQFGNEAYPNRIRMAELAQGCGLIPNDYNRVPGFFLDRHFFMPGFPQLAWPMLEWMIAQGYLVSVMPHVERSVHVYAVGESQLLEVMERLVTQFPAASLFSLPNIEAPQRYIDLGFRGPRDVVDAALQALCEALQQRGIIFASNST
jgi:molybdopterin-biosynthesis enzyme MoeA-like protein